jgi:hypothetical protein
MAVVFSSDDDDSEQDEREQRTQTEHNRSDATFITPDMTVG